MSELIRVCPKCHTERSLEENDCQNQLESKLCEFPLIDVPRSEQGSYAASAAATDDAAAAVGAIVGPSIDSTVAESSPTYAQSSSSSSSTTSSSSSSQEFCPNNHYLDPGDILCTQCDTNTSAPQAEPRKDPTIVDGWTLLSPLEPRSDSSELFLASSPDYPETERYILSIFREGVVPDPSIYALFEKMNSTKLSKSVAHGQVDGRYYEVWHEKYAHTLSRIISESGGDKLPIREFIRAAGETINDLSLQGVRHRALSPSRILLGGLSPLEFQLTGFEYALLSQYDLKITSPLTTTFYTAPEANVGGVSTASDWWSLGVILLETLSNGKCFDGVNKAVYAMHAVTRGIDVPENIPPDLATLLDGLLQRDPSKRWQWEQVEQWLDSKIPNRTSKTHDAGSKESGPSITLGGQKYFDAQNFALAAAESQNWEEASAALLRGAITTWLAQQQVSEKIIATVKTLVADSDLSADLKLALTLLSLNEFMPLVIKGEIVNPGWLLAHREDAYELVTGTANKRLQQLEKEQWLYSLGDRAKSVHKRIEQLEIEVNTPELEYALLVTSRHNLENVWEKRRSIFPDSEHLGLLSIIEKRHFDEEDLIILISADLTQFIPLTDILERASAVAQLVNYDLFDPEAVRDKLIAPRSELYNELDKRLQNFARCGVEDLDAWADAYRLDHRIELDRILILINVPEQDWKQPPKQEYLRHILDFFQRKIVSGVQRGPLVKQVISKSSASIDLMEFGTDLHPSNALLNHLLGRTGQTFEIEGRLLLENPALDDRLRRLVKRTKDFKRETGRHGLFLGFPFIVYRTSKTELSKTSLRIAPLMLWPIRVEAAVTSQGTVKLAFEKELEEARLNPALEGVLGIDKIQLAKWEQCAADILNRNVLTCADVMQAFDQFAPIHETELGRLPTKDTKVDAGKSFISSSAVLFNCDFSGKAIADDLRHILERPIAGTALEKALRISEQDDRPQTNLASDDLLDNNCVLDSDPSQLEAVALSRNSTGLHIEGPPGTGKSQTIVNIIADSVARGETILVVCEKQAALSIVEKRLTAYGLNTRLFLITDPTKNRQPLLRDLREQLEHHRNNPVDLSKEPRREKGKQLVRLRAAEDAINKVHKSIFETNKDIGLNYRQIVNELIQVDNEQKFLVASQLRDLFKGLSEFEVATLQEACGGIARLWFHSNFESSPLHIMKEFSVDSSSAQHIQETFLEFVSAEENRQSGLISYPNSIDIQEVDSLQNWLDGNVEYFAGLSAEEQEKLASWLDHFRDFNDKNSQGQESLSTLESCYDTIVKFDSSAHSDTLFKILVAQADTQLKEYLILATTACESSSPDETNIARWQLAFMLSNAGLSGRADASMSDLDYAIKSFRSAEELRAKVTTENPNCFDVSKVDPIKNWLLDNEPYFRNLPATFWSKVSELIPLFAPDPKNNSRGLSLQRELKDNIADLRKIDHADHNDSLFSVFSQLPLGEISKWVAIAKSASNSQDIFDSNSTKTAARWDIVRFLTKSGITTLCNDAGGTQDISKSFTDFARAEQERKETIAKYPQAYKGTDFVALKKWLGYNSDVFVTLPEGHRNYLVKLHEFFAPNNHVGNNAILDLKKIAERLHGLNPEFHDERFFDALSKLNFESLTEWAKLSKRAIKQSGFLAALDPFRIFARWRVEEYLGTLSLTFSEETLAAFHNAISIEIDLVSIRPTLVPVLSRLKLPQDPSHQNFEQLSSQIAELLKFLEAIKGLTARIHGCPLSEDFLTAIDANSANVVKEFMNNAVGSTKIYDCSENSKTELNKLSRYFESAWIQEQNQVISDLDTNLDELKARYNELPLLSDETFSTFSKFVHMENQLLPKRRLYVRAATILRIEDKASNLPVYEFERAVNDMFNIISELAVATGKIYSWQDNFIADLFHKNPDKEFFNDFVVQSAGAIKRCEARQNSLLALAMLAPWFEKSWIANRENIIQSNQSDLAELERREKCLSLTALPIMQALYKALNLELSLRPLRNTYNKVSNLLKLPLANAGEQNLRFLFEQIQTTLKDLTKVAKAISRFATCPLTADLANSLRKPGNVEFQQFVKSANGSILRQKNLAKSLNLLDGLNEWFEQPFIVEIDQKIRKNHFANDQLEKIQNSFPTLQAFQQFRSRSRTLDPRILQLLRPLRSQQHKLETIADDEISVWISNTIWREACLQWKGQLERDEPSLSLSSQETQTKIASISECLEKITELNRELLTEPDWNNGIGTQQQWTDVTKITGKNAKKLRELIDQGADLGLMKIRPIWLMNPEVASRLLPLKPGLFDKVIFDEASQLRVEYALPSLYRAKQAIVSGDDKQMPPSSYFTRKGDSGEDEDDDSDLDNSDYLTETQIISQEEAWNKRDIKDCPDLLTLASSILPKSRLEIHYRSEYRELIEFSNKAFYSGTLNVPAKHPNSEILKVRPIEVIKVNTAYKDQTNPGEAAEIVKLLRDYWLRKQERPTIGVVSFNKKQADLIAKALGEQAQKEPAFAAALLEEENREEGGEDVGFFVKNLENVQGDERDIIIFSTTFGRSENKPFSRNFGKLIQQGGERRLNVAITRAKRKVILVTSLPISEISDCISGNRTPSTPRDYLQCYLDYADRLSDGYIDQAHASIEKLIKTSGVKAAKSRQNDAFVDDVNKFVNDHGYESVVGQKHGAFYLDVSIVDPSTQLFAVGIECDPPDHPLLKSAYHREVWRQKVLKKSIKVIHRISSQDWYREKAREQHRLITLLKSTII